MPPTSTTLIVATTPPPHLGIGKSLTLPWPRLPSELSYFARVTKRAPPSHQNAVIMGRKTWDSIPPRFRPLPNRINVVISRSPALTQASGKGEYWVSGLEEGVGLLQQEDLKVHRIFVIGGSTIYKEALRVQKGEPGWVERMLHTLVLRPEFECDIFFPEIDEKEWERTDVEELVKFTGEEMGRVAGLKKEEGVDFEFGMWRRKT